MKPDPTTLLGYSTVLFLIFGLCFTVSELMHGTNRKAFWYSSPFLAAAISGFFFTSQTVVSGMWGLRIGAVFMLLAYGLGWQAISVMVGRPTYLRLILALCGVSFAASGLAGPVGPTHTVSSFLRMSIITAFHSCAALDLSRSSRQRTSAERLLFGIITVYAAIHGSLVALTGILPAPLGSQPSSVWAIILYNVLVIVEGIFIALAIIAIPRERLAAEHHRLMLQDPLTQAGNRRAMDLWMEQHVASDEPYALLLLDIDHFKAINDAYGHTTGDQVIILAVRSSHKVLPQDARLFRIGGEEFAVLLPYRNLAQALDTAHQLRTSFIQEVRQSESLGIEATLSIGADIRHTSSTAWGDVWQRADNALYAAKKAGRNTVVVGTQTTTF